MLLKESATRFTDAAQSTLGDQLQRFAGIQCGGLKSIHRYPKSGVHCTHLTEVLCSLIIFVAFVTKAQEDQLSPMLQT